MQRFGPWQIEGELARGGMGVVYRARRGDGTGGPVALKLLLGGRAEHRERFRREAELLSRLQHPGLVHVLGSGEEGGTAWMAMPLIEGRSLEQLERLEGPLPVPRLVALLGAVADAVAAVHQAGLVHRDLKPANVIVTAGDRPVVVDFGVARDARLETLTATGSLVGTPAYMAPELLQGGRPGPPSDVYALGVMLYEALAGELPFRAASLVEHLLEVQAQRPRPLQPRQPGTPPALVSLAMRCLAKDPAERPPDAAAFAAALGAAVRPAGAGSARRLALGMVLGSLALAGALLASGPRAPSSAPPSPALASPATPSPSPARAEGPFPARAGQRFLFSTLGGGYRLLEVLEVAGDELRFRTRQLDRDGTESQRRIQRFESLRAPGDDAGEVVLAGLRWRARVLDGLLGRSVSAVGADGRQALPGLLRFGALGEAVLLAVEGPGVPSGATRFADALGPDAAPCRSLPVVPGLQMVARIPGRGQTVRTEVASVADDETVVVRTLEPEGVEDRVVQVLPALPGAVAITHEVGPWRIPAWRSAMGPATMVSARLGERQFGFPDHLYSEREGQVVLEVLELIPPR